MSTQPTRPATTVRDVAYGVQQSRRLLIDTIKALADFADGITVVGAHAVHVWVQDTLGPIPMQATRDADVAVNPVFVASDPKLLDLMVGIGVEPALPDRPGVYGYATEAELPLAERTTIDLIVPEAYAGPGRRAARIAGQQHAASRAVGLELAVWDRHRRTLAAIGDPDHTVDAWIAGPAALLTAKAHKVHERLAQLATRPDRLRPKDSGDIALLMMASDPKNVAKTMASQSTHPSRDHIRSRQSRRLAGRDVCRTDQHPPPPIRRRPSRPLRRGPHHRSDGRLAHLVPYQRRQSHEQRVLITANDHRKRGNGHHVRGLCLG
jgi:hypothetical protein